MAQANIAKKIKLTVSVIKKYLSDQNGYAKCLLITKNTKVSNRDRRTVLSEAFKYGSFASQLRSTLNLPISIWRVQ